MATREHPWHIRRATTEHHEWHRNLVDLHRLTTAWISDLKIERPSHLISRGHSTGSEEIKETLWMLESLAESAAGSESGQLLQLEAILDDTLPEDLLGRLERTVWTVQAWAVKSVFDRASKTDRPALVNQLEQSAWKAGRACAASRWPDLVASDTKTLLAALRSTPFGGYPLRDGFLIHRAVVDEVRIELKSCAHHLLETYAEVAPAADKLCHLHAHWLRGFAYSLNSKITLETMMSPCIHRWSLTSRYLNQASSATTTTTTSSSQETPPPHS